MNHDDIVDHLVTWVASDDRVRALWLEANRPAALRRPYGGLDIHLSVDEPQYPEVLAELTAGLACLPGSQVKNVEDTDRFAKCLQVEVEALRFTLIAEQSHLLAKRPRAEVTPLVDKTLHLPHVLDYSLRGRA